MTKELNAQPSVASLVEELEYAVMGGRWADCRSLKAAIVALHASELRAVVEGAARLREALEVYADPSNWAKSPDDVFARLWMEPGVDRRDFSDGNEIARAALQLSGASK